MIVLFILQILFSHLDVHGKLGPPPLCQHINLLPQIGQYAGQYVFSLVNGDELLLQTM